jgi:hypothetical protein
MAHKSYALEISGADNVRTFTLSGFNNSYPLPQVIDPTITADDDSLITPEGIFFRSYMKGSGIQEIRFDWSTHSVRVTGATAHTFNDIDAVECLVRVLINDHFNAARKI